MGNINRKWGLILIGVIVISSLSLLTVKTVNAQVMSPPPQPAVSLPVTEFTVTLLNTSYDVPTTYSVDPYTGANVTHAGYYVQNMTVELIMKDP